MFKKRIIERELSFEEQEVYAYYADKMKESYGLSVLKLLEQKSTSSLEKLQFAFLAGKTETHGATQAYPKGNNDSSLSNGSAATITTGTGAIAATLGT